MMKYKENENATPKAFEAYYVALLHTVAAGSRGANQVVVHHLSFYTMCEVEISMYFKNVIKELYIFGLKRTLVR